MCPLHVAAQNWKQISLELRVFHRPESQGTGSSILVEEQSPRAVASAKRISNTRKCPPPAQEWVCGTVVLRGGLFVILYSGRGNMSSLYRKSIFEKDGKFKFLLLEQRDQQQPSLCESAESVSIFDMSCTVIAVNHLKNATEKEYAARRNLLELDGWTFRGEAFEELPFARTKPAKRASLLRSLL